jgi:hypothetical protein
MQLHKATLLTLIFVSSVALFLIDAHSNQASASNETNAVNTTISLVTQIYDINQETKTVDVKAFAFINSFPWNESGVNVWIDVGGQQIIINCTGASQEAGGGLFYQGESNRTICLLEGTGELFPFDSYKLRLKIQHVDFVNDNYTILTGRNQAYFDGAQWYSLRNLWKTTSATNELIPITIVSPQEMTANIQRSDEAFKFDFLVFLVPVIASYYFLGATLLIDSKKHLTERLTMYVSLFFFVPIFVIAIQGVFPYRTTISFPELLLVNLLITTAVLGIFSIIGRYRASLNPVINRLKESKPERRWDVAGVILALLLLIVLYTTTFYGKLPPQLSVLFSYGIVPAYIFWLPFATIETVSIRENRKSICFFAVGLVSSLITYFWAVTFLTYFLVLLYFGSLLNGITVGFYSKGRVRVTLLVGFFSGILYSLLRGVILGLFRVGGLDGWISGIVILGIFGPLYGAFSVIGIYFGTISKGISWKRKLSSKPRDI